MPGMCRKRCWRSKIFDNNTKKLAYYSALKKGFDIDKPKNLAKSVTLE